MTGMEPMILGMMAGSGGAAAAGGAAATAAGGFSFMSAMDTAFEGLSLFSGISSMFGANNADQAGSQMQANAAQMQALQLEQSAEFEKTRAIQEESQRRQRLNQILGQQMAMTAGRGIAIGSGSDLAIASFSEQEFEEENKISNSDSKFKQQQLRQNANQARLGGSASLLASKSRRNARTFDTVVKTAERVRTSDLFEEAFS